MIRLRLEAADTVLASDLCARCPYSPAGCCVAPPRYDWSDLARVVRHGHTAWLLEGLANGNLKPIDDGLAIRRPKGRLRNDPASPRIARCAFHAADRGCTIDDRQRPTTCNFYLCDRALDDGDRAAAARARAVHDRLVETCVRWDAILAGRVRAIPKEERYTEAFFAWLAEAHASLDPPAGQNA